MRPITDYRLLDGQTAERSCGNSACAVILCIEHVPISCSYVGLSMLVFERKPSVLHSFQQPKGTQIGPVVMLTANLIFTTRTTAKVTGVHKKMLLPISSIYVGVSV